jgi:catechol 2,3-dioxygenase-like lactoylglutathione lyase family enzyme
MKKRTGEPWMPAADYGRSLPAFTVNLVVRDIDRSLAFYTTVLEATVHYSDPDFAALRIGGAEFMLHADHAYEANPWATALVPDAQRGLGAELRLLGVDADAVADRARSANALFKDVSVRGHGWREAMVVDPDGYVWAVGSLIESDSV